MPTQPTLSKRELRSLQQARTRHGRRKFGSTLCEGLRCCREALANRPDWIELVLCSESFAASGDFAACAAAIAPVGTPRIVPDLQFADLAATDNPQGILCLVRTPSAGPPSDGIADPFVLVLDRLAEPGNAGTILRTAWAIGLSEVWMTDGGGDPYNPKAIRAGMGAQFSLTLRRFPDLDAVRQTLQTFGYGQLWLTVPRGGVSCFSDEFRLDKCGLVIGNEAEGVQECEGARRVSIPMPGPAESLNAAQAATVFLVEAVRRGIMAQSGALHHWR